MMDLGWSVESNSLKKNPKKPERVVLVLVVGVANLLFQFCSLVRKLQNFKFNLSDGAREGG